MGKTYNSLFASTIRLASWRRNIRSHNQLVVRQRRGTSIGSGISVIPFKGTNTLMFQFSWKPDTQLGQTKNTGGTHNVILAFSNVEIKGADEAPDEAYLYKDYIPVEYKGEMYYVRRITERTSPMQVRCTCMDYYQTWRWANFRARCHYGPLGAKYIRKTPPPSQGGRPYKNPQMIPGVCKHIMQSMRVLYNGTEYNKRLVKWFY